MKPGRAAIVFAPVGAAATAMMALACCLPWGIGAALGTMGLSVFFARYKMAFIVGCCRVHSVLAICCERVGRAPSAGGFLFENALSD